MIYINCKARKIKKIVAAGIATASIWMLPSSTEAAPQETKIHFISLNSATDAILLDWWTLVRTGIIRTEQTADTLLEAELPRELDMNSRLFII